MRHALTPPWLVVLYSIAGYAEAEIAEMTDWSIKTIKADITKYGILKSTHTPKERGIRKYVDTIRQRAGRRAALRAVENLLIEIAGPPLRV